MLTWRKADEGLVTHFKFLGEDAVGSIFPWTEDRFQVIISTRKVKLNCIARSWDSAKKLVEDREG